MKTLIAILFLSALAPSLPAGPTGEPEESAYKARIQAIAKVANSATRNVGTLQESLAKAVKLNNEQDAEVTKLTKQIAKLSEFAVDAVAKRDAALKKLELAQRTNVSFLLVGLAGGIFLGLIIRKKAQPKAEQVVETKDEVKAPVKEAPASKKPAARKSRK
jgi:hypothetical protein